MMAGSTVLYYSVLPLATPTHTSMLALAYMHARTRAHTCACPHERTREHVETRLVPGAIDVREEGVESILCRDDGLSLENADETRGIVTAAWRLVSVLHLGLL